MARVGIVKEVVMKELKVWPHLTVVAILCAAVAGGGVALWMKHRQNAQDQTLLSAARIQRVDGDVALQNSSNSVVDNADSWTQAAVNQPFGVGDRIYTRDNAHANLAFTGRNYARLYPNTSLDVLSLGERQTQLALRDGSAVFDVGYLAPGELFEVATPYGAVDLNQPGLYNVGIANGNAIVSVLSGLAQVVGLGGSGQISKGEMLTLLGQSAADVVLSRLDNRDAGYLVNDYYSSQYPHYYDGRYSNYDTYLSDPYYFDPYRRDVSYQYASGYLPGLNDLDYYGDWQNVDGYGYCWRPRVASDWAPYEDGYWMNDYPYGPTWVSSEPWGYAPYHYGRWTNSGNQWYWVPDRTSTPLYSPALVGWVPIDQNDIGWVPLGPGDAYAPRYYNTNWQPSYLTRTEIEQRNLANLYIPNAVTVLPVDEFSRRDWRNARKADRQMLAQVQPVLDPLTLTPLRNAVIHSAWGRGDKSIPPGIAKRLNETTVVTSSQPVAPPFRRDMVSSMKVRSAPDKAREQQFKVQDQRGPQNNADRVGRAVNAPAIENPADVRRAEQQQREQQAAQPREQRGNRAVQPQGERVAMPQPRSERVDNPAAIKRGRGQVRNVPAPQAAERRGPVRVEQTRREQPRGVPQSQPQPQAQPQPRPQPQPRVQPQTRAQQQPRPQPQQAPQAQPAARAVQPQRGGGQQNGGPPQRSAAPAPQAQPQSQGRGHSGEGQRGGGGGPAKAQPPAQPAGQPAQPGKGKGRKP